MAETNDKQAIAAEAQAAAGAASQAPLHIGIDVGSTTVKVAVLDDDDEILYSCYRRHHADIRATIVEVVGEAAEQYPATAHDHRHHRLGRPSARAVARHRLRSRGHREQNRR